MRSIPHLRNDPFFVFDTDVHVHHIEISLFPYSYFFVMQVTKNIPRTRDINGKYVRGSNTIYRKIDPLELRYDAYAPVSESKRSRIIEESSKQIKGKDAIEKTQLERKGNGYETFSFTLSCPLKEPDFQIALPKQFSYKAIHVQDAFLRVGPMSFRNGTNEIAFKEGVEIEDHVTKLANGVTIESYRTWNGISKYELMEAVGEGFQQIRLVIRYHRFDFGYPSLVYLLESNKDDPSDLHFIPWRIKQVINQHEIVCVPSKQGKRAYSIPKDFDPKHLLVPPLEVYYYDTTFID